MFGATLYGASQYGDTLFGVYTTEVAFNLKSGTNGVLLRGIGVLSSLPAKARIPELDYNWELIISEYGKPPTSNLGVSIGAFGDFEEFGVELQGFIAIGGSAVIHDTYICPIGKGVVVIGSNHDFSIETPFANNIKWSNIGSLDFTIGRDNIAGQSAMTWKGFVYDIKALGKNSSIVIYGANGVSLVQAQGVYFQEQQISRVGLFAKQALIDTEYGHYYIDQRRNLCHLSFDGKITIIGYEEFLSALFDDVILTYDPIHEWIHICDGTLGWIYSIKDNSLTTGPGNITAIGYQDSELMLVADSEISSEKFSITTGIYDLGVRKGKTIYNVEIGTDYKGLLEVALDFGTNINDSYKTTSWQPVYGTGKAHIPCYGHEFRIKVRCNKAGEKFKLDYIKLHGVIHKFSFIDAVQIV
jgi:hypothetical protein